MSNKEDKMLECTSLISNQLASPSYILIIREQIKYARFDIHTVALFSIQVSWDLKVLLGKRFLMFQKESRSLHLEGSSLHGLLGPWI